MLNDKDFEELIRPIIDIYNELECELLLEVARRFEIYRNVGGSLEWYVSKLDELGGLNQEAIKIIAKYSKRSETRIKQMLNDAGYKSIPIAEFREVYKAGGTLINPDAINIARVLENSYIEAQETFKLIHTKAFEGTKKAYMEVLNQAYLEVGGGYYDYNTSIQNACKKMAKQGITCATYLRNGKEVKMSIESVVRRDTLTMANQMANKANDKFINDMQAKHVYVSEHMGARNSGVAWQNHESWQGQVYLINGSDKHYKNFADTTGYGKVDGLAGVNCRHYHYAFFPGFSVMPKRLVDDEENSRLYELIQKQRYYERGIRSWKKQLAIHEGLKDEINIVYCKNKIKQWQGNLKQFIDENDELKRDYMRERVY